MRVISDTEYQDRIECYARTKELSANEFDKYAITATIAVK